MNIARITLCRPGPHYPGSKLTTARVENTAGDVYFLTYGADVTVGRVALAASMLAEGERKKQRKQKRKGELPDYE